MKNSFSKKFKIMNRNIFKVCEFCNSGNLTKFGFRKTRSGKKQISNAYIAKNDLLLTMTLNQCIMMIISLHVFHKYISQE